MQPITRNTRLIIHVPGYPDTGATVLEIWERGRRLFLALDEPRPVQIGSEVVGLANRLWVPFDALILASTDSQPFESTKLG